MEVILELIEKLIIFQQITSAILIVLVFEVGEKFDFTILLFPWGGWAGEIIQSQTLSWVG